MFGRALMMLDDAVELGGVLWPDLGTALREARRGQLDDPDADVSRARPG